MGGEPTIRKDLYQIFVPTKHIFILFTSALNYNNSIKIFEEVKKNNVELHYIPTIHHTSKDFNWNIFWDTIQKAKEISNIKIKKINLVNYKISNILKDAKNKCKELDIFLNIKKLDENVVSSRIEKDKKFKKI